MVSFRAEEKAAYLRKSKIVDGIRFPINTVIISGGQKAKNMTIKVLRKPNRHFSEKQISSVYHPQPFLERTTQIHTVVKTFV